MKNIDMKFLAENEIVGKLIYKHYRDNIYSVITNMQFQTFLTLDFRLQLGILLDWLISRNIIIVFDDKEEEGYATYSNNEGLYPDIDNRTRVKYSDVKDQLELQYNIILKVLNVYSIPF